MSVNGCRRVDMHAFVWEYRSGRGCARSAQLDDSLVAWRGASSLRARQASRSRLATAENHRSCLGYSSESDARSSLMRDRAASSFHHWGASCGEEEPVYQRQDKAKAGTRQLMEVSRRTPHFI